MALVEKDLNEILKCESLYTELLQKTEDYVRGYMEQYKDTSHDFNHVQRVRRTACQIASTLKPSPSARLVELAALLHDVGDAKFIPKSSSSNEILSQTMDLFAYPDQLKEAILWIVPRVSFRHELDHPEDSRTGPWVRELWCVQDADRLEAIGAIGIARCFTYNAVRNFPLYQENILPLINMTADQYNTMAKDNKSSGAGKSNARNHFYEKLLKVKGMMKTEEGRRMAEIRHALLKQFIIQFDHECNLDNSTFINLF